MLADRIKIVSGGQTGVDQGALDFGLQHGVDVGGWAPRGRITVAGPLPSRFDFLRELDQPAHPNATDVEIYRVRTEANARDSDVTLVLVSSPDQLSEGTQYTIDMCQKHGKEYLVVNMSDPEAVPHVRGWVTDRLKNTPLVLNIAGPREQKAPGIYEQAMGFLRDVVITEA